LNPQLLYSLLCLAFGAGGVYFLIKQSRKDVTGLGKVVRGETKKNNSRHQNVMLALMLLAPPEQREKIAELLRDVREDSE